MIQARRHAQRLACLALGLLLLLCCALPCFAAAEQTRQPTVRVAVLNYTSYLQRDADGTLHGYAYEYLQEIQKYTGWQYEFIDMSLAQATAALASGTIDLVPGNQYTPERAEQCDYSAAETGKGGSVLCVRADDMRYCYNDYAAYGGMKIAALTGTVRIAQAQQKLAQYGVQAEFIEYDTSEASRIALETGEVDAILMSSIRCESQLKILARLDTVPLYFCTNKQRPELKTALDLAIAEIHLDKPYYEAELNEKYYGSVPVQLAFTQAEKQYIAAAGPITVAVSQDLIPVEYYSAQHSRYRGLVPDSFALLSEYSGLSFHFVPRPDKDSLCAQLQSGEVLLIGSVANEPTLAEQWGVSLTAPYFDNSVSLVMGGGVADYKDKSCTVALRAGYPFLESLARAQGYTNLLYLDSFNDCITAVCQRRADLTLIPSNCTDSLLRSHTSNALTTLLVPDSYTNFCIGVAQGADPLLVSILNKSIASIPKEQRTELLVQNLAAIHQSVTLGAFIAAHRVGILVGALIAAVLGIAVVFALAVTRQRANQRLQAALRSADAANRAKTDFLARMSHDMRTPMNGILGLSYLMEDQTDLAAIKKELPQLREAGQYLLQLINDVLDVNKVESGTIKLHPKECDEEQLFSSIIALLKPQMEKKNLRFNFERHGIVWTNLILDEQRVKQIFVNLLSNAVKFTPSGGRIDLIMTQVAQDETMVRDRFIIRDTGIGITEEFLPRLFEPFAQENRIAEGIPGTGLGLAIVKSLVELMGGSISVKSAVDQGTEFTLYLNFPLASHPAAVASVSTPDRLPDNTHILLCEDHPLNAQIATRLLEKYGAVVTWKENGQLGVEAFARSVPYFYDAVLMDIRMPVLDGLGAARAIRALHRPDAGTVPIIAMTANAYEEDIRESMDAGMNAHLAKPVEPDRLLSVLSRLLHAPQ